MLKRFISDWKFRIIIISSIWLAWWILAAFQSYLAAFDQPSEIFWHSLLDFAYVGLIWVVVTPVIIEFASKIEIKGNWLAVLVPHLFFCVLILMFRSGLYAILTISHSEESINFLDYWKEILVLQLLGNFVIYGLIVTAYHAADWYLGFKSSQLSALELKLKSVELERQLSEANLTALRMQLNPHFLFNSMHSVASLIRTGRNEHAIETISTLSDLLRTTVYEGKVNEITIREEVKFVEKYLSIEQLRFSDRLKILWEVDEKILNSKIPKLLLQPLVENSLKHGLGESKCGTLSILIKRPSDDLIHISVVDNGMGLPEGFQLNGGSRVGLRNTVERLEAMYNSNYKFNISNNQPMPGTRVDLMIPNRR